ncbi:adhesion G-protein coupled receptor G7-like [Polymixia lowei]
MWKCCSDPESSLTRPSMTTRVCSGTTVWRTGALKAVLNTTQQTDFCDVSAATPPTLLSSCTQQFSMRKKFLSSFSLAVLLGLSWILGYLALVTKGDAHLIFSIFFCLCTTTQGFQIFILFTARTSAFKKNTAKVIQHISAQIPLHSRTFTLWKNKGPDSTESYREMDPELSSHI